MWASIPLMFVFSCNDDAADDTGRSLTEADTDTDTDTDSDTDADTDSDTDADTDSDTDADTDTDTTKAGGLPDPGTGVSYTWDGTGIDNTTPESALAAGVYPDHAPYITDDENAFFVFATDSATTEVSVFLGGGVSALEYAHLHNGEGLVLGAEIKASEVKDGLPDYYFATWPVEPDGVYVLEIGAAGFF